MFEEVGLHGDGGGPTAVAEQKAPGLREWKLGDRYDLEFLSTGLESALELVRDSEEERQVGMLLVQRAREDPGEGDVVSGGSGCDCDSGDALARHRQSG